MHASTGSASDYADLNLNAKQGFGLSNHIRGVIGAGYISPSYNNSISYFVMASQATAVDYGDFTLEKQTKRMTVLLKKVILTRLDSTKI